MGSPSSGLHLWCQSHECKMIDAKLFISLFFSLNKGNPKCLSKSTLWCRTTQRQGYLLSVLDAKYTKVNKSKSLFLVAHFLIDNEEKEAKSALISIRLVIQYKWVWQTKLSKLETTQNSFSSKKKKWKYTHITRSKYNYITFPHKYVFLFTALEHMSYEFITWPNSF